jgi:CBS domain containing-hemolysin-like protein
MIVLAKSLAIIGLVLINGFFVAAEFAIVKVRATRLTELAERGKVRARIARGILGDLDAYLSACQLGVTMASLALGWLGEPLVADQLRPLLLHLRIENPAVVSTVSILAGFILITFLHIIFGEQAPKIIAIRRVESAALWVAVPLRLFYYTFLPAIWLLNQGATLTLAVLGIQAASDHELAHTESELRLILSEAARGGHISEHEQRISERALRLADLQVRQVMVPRGEVVYFSLADPLETNLAKARRHSFTRYPLCETDLDRPMGMIHIRDVLWVLREREAVDLRALAHELLLVSENESVEAMLERFRDSHIHLAVVVDEAGTVSGVVTLEDVLEQLVGAIHDESDREQPWIKPAGPDRYEIAGRAPLTMLTRRLGIEFDAHDIITLSGYVTAELGRFPRPGDRVVVGPWSVTVVRVDALKIAAAMIERLPPE